jgi:hypothetical protein
LVTVALNQEYTGCGLVEASQRGGVRFYARALARFVSKPTQPLVPGETARKHSVKQSYNRLSGCAQAPICGAFRQMIDKSVSFLTDRPLHANAAGGSFAFLVSR